MLLHYIVIFLFAQVFPSDSQASMEALDVTRIYARPAGKFLEPFLRPRTPGSEGSKYVREFLLNHFEEIGWSVEKDESVQKIPSGDTVTFTNLIFTHNTEASKRLILAAHYDSKVTVDGQQHDGQFIGATDSAWPCALLVELSTALNDRLKGSPKFSQVSLQIIFFDGEEAYHNWSATDSLYGSRHLAQEWSKRPEETINKIELFVLLDLLGATQPQIYPWISETTSEYRKLVLAEQQFIRTLPSLNQKSQAIFNEIKPARLQHYFVDDDHVPFMKLGVRVLHLIPVPFPSVWHTIKDDESALDNPTIFKLTHIIHNYLLDYFGLGPALKVRDDLRNEARKNVEL